MTVCSGFELRPGIPTRQIGRNNLFSIETVAKQLRLSLRRSYKVRR
jgi:hypothetical protein